MFQGIKRGVCASTKQFSSTFVAKHLSFAKAGLLASCICNSRFGKLFRRQEESGWGLEAVDFVCLLHRVLGASKEAKTLWFEHLLQVLLSVNTFLLMSNVCTADARLFLHAKVNICLNCLFCGIVLCGQ